jgi:starch synthase
MVSRLVEQKGLDIIRMVLENILLSHKVKFLILGNGEYQYENFFEYLKDKYPDRLAFYCGYNNKLAHQIEAGADIFLMPSRYEPCGLNQIYSLKYGTIPIVRKTGGLADTVSLYDWQKQSGTGFVFHDYTATGLEWAMNYALETFGHKSAWKKIMQNAMKKNYSWDHQIKKYVKLYKNFLT